MSRPARRGARLRDDGFTILELSIATLVLGIMLTIATGALISLQNATARTNAMISIEQNASTTLAQMARDIRSAHSITFVSPTTNAAYSVVLNINQPTGGTIPVEWVYQPPAAPATVGTLSRVMLTHSLAASATNVLLTDVANGTTPVFSYFNLAGGSSMPTTGSTAIQTLQNCTTAIGVNLTISPAPVPGVSAFSESDRVAITDQQQLLSANENYQCG